MVAHGHRHPAYKRIISAVVLAGAVLWAGYLLLWPHGEAKGPGTGIALGAPAPDFTLKGIDGKSYRLADLKGRPVMLNFFATWCVACKSEAPLLVDAYKQYADRGLVILGVDLDESDLAVKQFAQAYGATFPMVIDQNDRVSRLYDIVPLPTSYFLDKQSIVQAKWTGELTREQLSTQLQKILQ